MDPIPPRTSSGTGKNPFVNHTRVLPWHQQLKLVLLGASVFPLRALLSLLLVSSAAIVSAIGTAGMRPQDYELPLPRWRAWLLMPLRPIMRTLLVVMGVWVQPIYLMAALGGSAVSAAENARYPLIGPVLVALQSLLVQRDHRGKQKQVQSCNAGGSPSPCVAPLPPSTQPPTTTIAKITARANDPRFGRVLIFPEGTCGNGDVVLQFKIGAFSPGLPVQPVTVQYPWRHLDVSWCSDEPTLGGLLFRILCQVYTPMVVTYLPVITPTPEERADATLYARRVQEVIAQSLAVPATAHSYDDYLLAHTASVAHFPPEIGVVEIQALRDVLDVDTKTADEYLKLFMRADTEKTGRISADQFAEIFLPAATVVVSSAPTPEPFSVEDRSLNPQRALRRLFSLLDLDGNGWLDYREFLIGLSIVNERSRAGGRSDALRMAFKIIDSGGRGAISREEFRRILLRAWPEMDPSVADAAFSSADVDHDGRLTMAEFVAWGDAHGDQLPVFRQAFMGFSDEAAMLKTAESGDAPDGSRRRTAALRKNRK